MAVDGPRFRSTGRSVTRQHCHHALTRGLGASTDAAVAAAPGPPAAAAALAVPVTGGNPVAGRPGLAWRQTHGERVGAGEERADGLVVLPDCSLCIDSVSVRCACAARFDRQAASGAGFAATSPAVLDSLQTRASVKRAALVRMTQMHTN